MDLPPKDIIYSAPPILYYDHNDDDDKEKGGNLDRNDCGSPSIHPYIVDSLVFPSGRQVPRGDGFRRVTTMGFCLPIRYSGSAYELCPTMLTTTVMKALCGGLGPLR